MKRYLVGGAVRDALLGLPVVDRDWVVVGADVDALRRGRLSCRWARTSRSSSIRETHEEHALARTERKTAPGYRGFAFHAGPDVTLEEDLLRRDLTINAMAQDEDGALIDPFGGKSDLENARLPPCLAGLRRRPGAHPAAGPLRRAPSGLPRRPRDRGPDAADGRGRRSRCPGAGARLARALARPDGNEALADVRGAARLRRARAGAARGGAPVRRAAARRLPPRGRHRRAPDDGARHGGAARDARWRCATPASATTSARERRRPRSCRSTCATKSAASRWCGR